jgi:hypothetical protein
VGIVGLDAVDERVTALRVQLNPAKLAGIRSGSATAGRWR